MLISLANTKVVIHRLSKDSAGLGLSKIQFKTPNTRKNQNLVHFVHKKYINDISNPLSYKTSVYAQFHKRLYHKIQ